MRESVRERERLLRERSHLVHPVQFLFLLNEQSQRSAMKVRAGLWMYQRFAKRRAPTPSEIELKRVQRALDAGHQWLVPDSEDAQCRSPSGWRNRLQHQEGPCRSLKSGCECWGRPGPWRAFARSDHQKRRAREWKLDHQLHRTMSRAESAKHSTIRTGKPMIGGVRGSHIVMPRFSGAPTAALYTEASDGRPVFVLPWNEQMLVGTTEMADSGDPGKTSPSTEEIEYLLRMVSKLFPKAKFSAHDIKYAFAGVRPLPNVPGDKPSGVTRRHFLHDHTDEGAAKLISVIGGKLTTAASLAREITSVRSGLRSKSRSSSTLGPAVRSIRSSIKKCWTSRERGLSAKKPRAA